MTAAVIGVRMHSGWGALVAVAGDAASFEVIDRRRIAMADPNITGPSQPYHLAAKMSLSEARQYISECARVSEKFAVAELRKVVEELRTRGHEVARVAVLLASGRLLPALPEILVSHPLLHTAEGEFFRVVFSRACEQLGIPVIGIRERDLDERVHEVLGNAASLVLRRIAGLKSSLGSPWTEDQKKASLAAAILLAAGQRGLQLPNRKPSIEIDVG